MLRHRKFRRMLDLVNRVGPDSNSEALHRGFSRDELTEVFGCRLRRCATAWAPWAPPPYCSHLRLPRGPRWAKAPKSSWVLLVRSQNTTIQISASATNSAPVAGWRSSSVDCCRWKRRETTRKPTTLRATRSRQPGSVERSTPTRPLGAVPGPSGWATSVFSIGRPNNSRTTDFTS